MTRAEMICSWQKERAIDLRTIELYKSGQMELRDGVVGNITPEAFQRAIDRVAELDARIAEEMAKGEVRD